MPVMRTLLCIGSHRVGLQLAPICITPKYKEILSSKPKVNLLLTVLYSRSEYFIRNDLLDPTSLCDDRLGGILMDVDDVRREKLDQTSYF